MDIVVYEPKKTPRQGRRGFIGLPLQQKSDVSALCMSDNMVDTIIAKLNEIIRTNSNQR